MFGRLFTTAAVLVCMFIDFFADFFKFFVLPLLICLFIWFVVHCIIEPTTFIGYCFACACGIIVGTAYLRLVK